MKQDPEKIAKNIKGLLDELVAMATAQNLSTRSTQKVKSTKGASGALSLLIQEGFFDSPKDISAVMIKLKEVGRYYSQPSVAMNLLNLNRRRVLNRFENKKTKNWEYVVRK